MRTSYSGRRAILAWSVCAGLLLLGALTALSIGFFLLPIAALITVFAAWRFRAWPEAVLGAMIGPAAVCALIALANLGYRRCEQGPALVGQEGLSQCGGLDPLPWLLAAIGMGLAGASAWLLWCRGSSSNGLTERGGAA